ncbi:MAG: rod shape-determining protein MreC [Deltaproteobacteria bacterium]|nr:rod shape-determining protein MreC [Deltaproteobacteria bacterium]
MSRLYGGVRGADAAASRSGETPVPGKRTLTEALQLRAVVRAAPAGEDAHTTAARGVTGPGGALPFADVIAASFGPAHADTVRGIAAHTGGAAAAAAQDLGANAYATGNAVAFAGTPDLHTAAHEAAHVVQQRQGVSLKGGLGASGDVYEQHADAVADRVVAGRPAGDLLRGGITAASADPITAVQLSPSGTRSTAEMVYGEIVSRTQDPGGATSTVIINRGSKDGVHRGMTLALSWLGGAIGSDGFIADSYEVKDSTVVAHVSATLDQLKPCDSAAFLP